MKKNTIYEMVDGPDEKKVSRFIELVPGLVLEDTYHIRKVKKNDETSKSEG